VAAWPKEQRMDDRHFDRLARAIGAGASRRGVLKTLVGGALGSFAAAVGMSEADAKRRSCRLLDADCVQNQDCCSKHCCNGACCDGGPRCPDGSALCGGRCLSILDLKVDAANCGTCGHACADLEICAFGTCRSLICPDGQHLCENSCVDTSNDPANCGACGSPCQGQERCVAGACHCCQGGNSSGCGNGTRTDQICCDYPQGAVVCCISIDACFNGALSDCIVTCGLDDSASCPPNYPVAGAFAISGPNGCPT